MAANKRKIQANAQKYLQKGQLDKAQKEYEHLVKLDPRDANSRLKLGDIALRQGHKDAAAEAYLKVAEQFMKDGFDAKSVAIYKQIGKIDPERLDIYEPLAELYQRLGLTSEALAALQTAADAFHRDGRKRDALELLRKMATLDPTNTTSRLKIADLLRQAEMPEDALAEYNAVAEELARQGARDELLGVYDRILELEPERTATIGALAQILVDQGHVGRAEPYARKLIEQSPDLPEGHELLARIHTELGREDAAAETYKTLAELYRRVGDDDKAREISQRIFGSEIASESSDSASLGGDLSDLPDTPPTEQPSADLMEQTLDLSSGDAVAGFSADAEQLLAEANVYLRYGKAPRAIATLDGLLATEPDHRPALEKLGEAHAEEGDAAKAIDIWNRAIQVALLEEDEVGVATLRSRIEALESGGGEPTSESVSPDPDAAIRGGADPEESELIDDISLEDVGVEDPDPEPEVASAAATPATLDHDVELEIDLGEEALDEDMPLEDEDEDVDDEVDLEIDLDLEVDDAASLEPSLESDADFPEPDANSEPPPRALADETVFQVDDSETDAAGSATTPQQIAESLEEADFYFEQGLFEEAEGLYEKVLEAAPNHPQAMVRLGEIANKRGDDPASSGAGLAAQTAAPAEQPADAHSEAGTDGVGDELVEWGDDDTGEETGAASNDDSELEIDVELPEDPVDDELDANADTAVSMQAPETQPEIELSLDDESEIELSLDDESAEADAETDPEEPDIQPEAGLEAPEIELVADDAAVEEPPVEEPELGPTALEAAESERVEETPQQEEGAPVGEGDTFDLAAELSDVFDDGEPEEASHDDGFDAIFREFKKGVKEQLSDGDFEAHYDLGIAYREMGLLEDAVSEFQTSLDSPELKLSSLHMLGLCALDRGQPNDATAHFEQALSLPAIPIQQQAALRYDLGRGFESAGDACRARSAYEAVAAVDPEYQDVAERLAALPDAAEAVPDSMETFESFDDLIAEAEAVLDTDGQGAGDDSADASAADSARPALDVTQTLDEDAPELEAELEPVLDAVLETEAEPTVQAEPTTPPPETAEVLEVVDEEGPDPEPAPRRRRKKISFL